MNNFKKNIFKSRRELIPIGLCKKLLGFTYKGTGDFVVQYKLCGDTLYTQHTFEGLLGNGDDEAYYDITADLDFPTGLCVQENTVTKISGGSPTIFNPDFGSSVCQRPLSDYTFYQVIATDCSNGVCTGVTNNGWIHNLVNNLFKGKYYYNSENDKSYQITSTPFTYLQYVAIGEPPSLKTNQVFSSLMYNSCSCTPMD